MRVLISMVVAVAATALFAASACAAAGRPSLFRHDLRRIEGHLRMGIEFAPPELGEGLGASKAVCGLAEEAEERGDGEGATAAWSTLSQLVENRDRPAAERVDGALRRADSGLVDLRRRFARAWADRRRATELRLGVARTREGIQRLRAAIETIGQSFEAWPAHRCRMATDAIEAGIARIPAAAARISTGMRVLWGIVFSTAG